MEGQRMKKHFPSIRRNLESEKQPETIKSLLRFREDQLPTSPDFPEGSSTGELNFGSSEIRYRHLRKKRSEMTQPTQTDNIRTSTTMSSIAKLAVEEEPLSQQIEQVLSQERTRFIVEEYGLSEKEARAAVFDGVFLSGLSRAGKSENWQQQLISLVHERLRKHGSMVAARLSCEDKENRINDMIERRLQKLADLLTK